jgi:group I intron endonuclease
MEPPATSSRDELKRAYRERTKPAGVFQIKNLANGKILLGSSLNLEGPLNSHKFMLRIGSHRNAELQRDYNAVGADQFVFEILEEVKVTDDPRFNLENELEFLEELWIEKLHPFDGNGYNTDKKIRQV